MFIAIDPGNEQSAYVVYADGLLVEKGILPNDEMLARIYYAAAAREQSPHIEQPMILPDTLAIEMIASYGMPVGKEVFDTCVWIGRFIQAWDGPHTRVYRKTVKMHLCGSMKAKDASIRQALLDRYGPGKEKAIGTKKAPGPLYGVSSDVWSALAVAVTYADHSKAGPVPLEL